jgi:hypothetical protein
MADAQVQCIKVHLRADRLAEALKFVERVKSRPVWEAEPR